MDSTSPTSFFFHGLSQYNDLLTINGIECPTFKDAAMRRGLLESDQSIAKCMMEAVTFQMPNELIRLFATLLVHCQPSDVRKLWDDYFEAMSEDYKRVHENIQTQIACTLQSIAFYVET